MNEPFVGQSLPRVDAPAKVTGQALYPGDIVMPGMLHAKVVWPAQAPARLLGLETAEAAAMPGVVRVLTWQDVPRNEFGIYQPDQQVLTQGLAYWAGDPLALVVAETEAQAARAARRVGARLEPLPVVSDPEAALRPESPLVHPERGANLINQIHIERGDLAQGFAQADVVVEEEYHTHCVEHAFLQPEAGLGFIDGEGRVTVICAAQWAHDDVRQIAHALRLPESQVREIVPAVGGAFGGREDISIQLLVALAAFHLRRPVRLVWSREESFHGHGKRHPFIMRHRWAATRAGKLVAAQAEIIADAGAHLSTSLVVLANACSFAVGPYVVPNVRVEGRLAHTHNPPSMAMRGFGAAQVPLAYEGQMDRLALALGLDPVEFRLRNIVHEGGIAITGNVMPPGCGAEATLQAAAREAGWHETSTGWQRPAPRTPSAPHRRRGLGLACSLKNIAYSFGFDDRAGAQVTLQLSPNGDIHEAEVRVGATEVGQGVLTVMLQVAADALHVPPTRIRLITGDTARVPDGGSVSASRQTYMCGNAVLGACQQALAQRNQARQEGSEARAITASYVFRCLDVRRTTPFDPQTGQCEPHVTYGYCTQAAEVEVDLETGAVEVLQLVSAQDAGRAINPRLLQGQVAGAVHMGIGFALTEDFQVVDGQIRTRNLAEYLIPTSQDMPRELVSLTVEVPDPTGPYGAKGVGELPTLPTAPAILSAIHNATDVWLTRLPASPERVFWALRRATPGPGSAGER
ncbi:MAG: xanthine dehydrogenase family protein [Chloroflexi bacterium]|nr:xanthine dehydrogenase family protein [Chloroflexota bacterium]